MTQYSQTLIGWNDNTNTPDDLSLGAYPLQYGTNAAEARDYLKSVKGWTITGDSPTGMDCGLTHVEEVLQTDLTIYPNPVRDWVTIHLPEGKGGITMEIFTITGQVVLQGTFSEITGGVDVSTLHPGTYQMTLKSNDGFYSTMFVKE